MAYKSKRLLLEAVTKEMDAIRKLLTQLGTDVVNNAQFMMSQRVSDAQESLNDLRKLFDEVTERLEKPSINDLENMEPSDYVTTMMPLVTQYHRRLMIADRLTSCICTDLGAAGAVIILIGEGSTSVKTAYDPARPDVALAIEAILAALDNNTKQVLTEGVAEAEKQFGIADYPVSEIPEDSDLRIRYGDPIQEQDLERNRKAAFVINASNVVIKDRNGPTPRGATEEEIDSCLLVKEPGDE
jgi:hypothetical protein